MACKNVFTSLSLNFGNNQREVSKGQGCQANLGQAFSCLSKKIEGLLELEVIQSD